MKLWAIILGAGSGSRLASHTHIPKQFLPLGDAPVFWHSARTFSRIAGISGIVFVFPPEENPPQPAEAHGPSLVAQMEAQSPLGLPWRVAYGGARRQDSVANALSVLPHDCDGVLIHDSARPFVSATLVRGVMEALCEATPGVIPGLPVTDTVKNVDSAGIVLSTPSRDGLRAVQTPQGFLLGPLQEAHARANREGWDVTDDASLLERCGVAVKVVAGDPANRKITNPEDLSLLQSESFAAESEPGVAGQPVMPSLVPCSGLGYDVHRYGGNRPFILGGVPIACDVSVSAHSDGDTLLHALMDALLGCIGKGDIGRLFPDADPSFDNISSGILLSEVLALTKTAGLVITRVDITIVAQVPRISPHREAIAANLAKMLNLPKQAVNVKATTEEHLGFTGEKKGIKVFALVSGLQPWPFRN